MAVANRFKIRRRILKLRDDPALIDGTEAAALGVPLDSLLSENKKSRPK
jgi:hypothetical protein